jgi:hypothetical protein
MIVMHPDDALTAAEKLDIALQLAAEGLSIQRENLRREHPGETEEQIEMRLVQWVNERPMDAPGRVISAPRGNVRPG